MSKPREWYLNPVIGYKCEVNENGIGLTGHEVHVIEYSAYERMQISATDTIADLQYKLNVERARSRKLVEALKKVQHELATAWWCEKITNEIKLALAEYERERGE